MRKSIKKKKGEKERVVEDRGTLEMCEESWESRR